MIPPPTRSARSFLTSDGPGCAEIGAHAASYARPLMWAFVPEFDGGTPSPIHTLQPVQTSASTVSTLPGTLRDFSRTQGAFEMITDGLRTPVPLSRPSGLLDVVGVNSPDPLIPNALTRFSRSRFTVLAPHRDPGARMVLRARHGRGGVVEDHDERRALVVGEVEGPVMPEW